MTHYLILRRIDTEGPINVLYRAFLLLRKQTHEENIST